MLLPDSEMMTVSACWLISIGQASYDNIHGLVFYDWRTWGEVSYLRVRGQYKTVGSGAVLNAIGSTQHILAHFSSIEPIWRGLVLSPYGKERRTNKPRNAFAYTEQNISVWLLLSNNVLTYVCFLQRRILYRASSVGRRRTNYTPRVVSISLSGYMWSNTHREK